MQELGIRIVEHFMTSAQKIEKRERYKNINRSIAMERNEPAEGDPALRAERLISPIVCEPFLLQSMETVVSDGSGSDESDMCYASLTSVYIPLGLQSKVYVCEDSSVGWPLSAIPSLKEKNRSACF